jgi:bifunctional non-homologous end joining protein LigD
VPGRIAAWWATVRRVDLRPMLLRPGPIPSGEGWAFELKYDGFRAIVSTDGDLRVRSRRGWTTQVSELRELSAGLVLDGGVVAFNGAGARRTGHWWCERVLHGNRKIPVTFVAFDLLRVKGQATRSSTRSWSTVSKGSSRIAGT